MELCYRNGVPEALRDDSNRVVDALRCSWCVAQWNQKAFICQRVECKREEASFSLVSRLDVKVVSEIVLLTSKYCGSCEAVKQKLRQTGKAGLVREVDIDSTEGQKIAQEHHVEAVPECFLVQGNRLKRCSDEEFVNLVNE